MLDDYDIMSLIKQNINSQDRVIAGLASSLINRKLPRIRLSKEEIDYDFLNKIKQQFMKNIIFLPKKLIILFILEKYQTTLTIEKMKG